jgi:hypothetical protein
MDSLIQWVDGTFPTRLALGLGNPNTAGALIAALIASFWGVLLASKWRFFLAAAVLTVPLGGILALTRSRGALLALVLAALALVLVAISRRLGFWSACRPVLCLGIVAFLFLILPSGNRVQGLGEDASLITRWNVYSRVPEMIRSAPSGWGVGRSGEAYQNWFQPIGETVRYRHLLSTHLTWIAERGWLVGAIYLFAWFSVLAVSWPSPKLPVWFSGGFACVLVSFVCMMFSHVGERWESWPAAAIWLLIVGAFRIRTAEGRDVKLPIGMSAFACAALSLVILSWPTPGDLRTSPGVELKDGIVWMGADADRQRAWTGMVVDTKVVGEWYGQQIRTHPAKHPVAIVWARIFSIEADNLLLTGDVASSIDIGRVEAKEIFWINPPPQVPPFLRSTPTTVFWGGRRFGSSVEWRSFASRSSGEFVLFSEKSEFFGGFWKSFLDQAPNP